MQNLVEGAQSPVLPAMKSSSGITEREADTLLAAEYATVIVSTSPGQTRSRMLSVRNTTCYISWSVSGSYDVWNNQACYGILQPLVGFKTL
jgi:hypothetical protein